MEEEQFFAHSGVTVTNTRLIAPKQTFALNGIGSVKMEKERPTLIIGAALVLIALIAFAAGKNIWFIAVPLLTGVLFLLMKPNYHVVVGIGSGEVKALNSKDKAFIEAVIAAVNQAIVTRG